ncbi:MAG TPA: inositol monophosphatase family protein [Patescibacteria group bacterium]
MLDTAIKAVKSGGKIISDNYGRITSLKMKGGNWREVVSQIDLDANDQMLKVIEAAYPDHNIISEESILPKKPSDYTWYVDPLDGTTNYLMQFPFFAVCVGLAFKGEPILGVVYNPILNELFTAEKDQGAELNGQKIEVSNNNNLKLTLANFCHAENEKSVKQIGKIYEIFKMEARDFRRLGSGGLDMAYLAAGRYDVYISNNDRIWDVIPGYVIAKEAGAKITDWQGSDWTPDSAQLLITNQELHKKVLELLTL